MKKEPSIKKERSCFFVLVGIFLLLPVSLFTCFTLLPGIKDVIQMEKWKTTKATIIKNQKQYFYYYDVSGVTYRNNRVTVLNDIKIQAYYEEKKHKNGTINIWYNKEDPNKAIINKTIPWSKTSLKLCLLFILGFIGWRIINLRLPVKNTVLPADYDEKPWKYDFYESLNGIIKSDGKSKMYLFWFGAIIINIMFTIPIGIEIINSTYKSDVGIWSYIFLGFFPLIGIIMIYVAYIYTKDWTTYGKTLLEVNPFPGYLGGTLSGKIMLLKGFKNKEFKLTLSCIKHEKKESIGGSINPKSYSKSTTIKEKKIWSSELYAKKEPIGKDLHLMFVFDIPRNLPISESPSNLYHYWKLNITSEGGKKHILNRNFIVPVYRK